MNRLQMVMYLSWGFWLAYSYVHLFSKREKPGGKALFFLCLLPPIPVLMLKADMMTIFTSVILLIILLAMFAKSSTPAKSNGTGSSSNADSSPGDGILTPDGGDHSPHGGAPSPLGGAPSPHGGAPSPHGGAPSPLGGAPSPLSGAPSPLSGAQLPHGDAPGESTVKQPSKKNPFKSLFRRFKHKTTSQNKTNMTPDLEPASRAPFFSFVGLLAASLVFISLFLVLGKDFKSGSDYFIRRYRFVVDAAEVMKKTGDASETLNRENPNSPEHTTASAPAAPESTDAPPFREIIIGNSKKDSHITIADTDAGNAHLKLTLMPDNFVVRNISRGKKVDINGKYLNKPTLQEGDRVILNGKDTIRVVKINKQYPLGRSIKLAIGKNVAAGEVNKEHFVTLYTLLNKTVMIKYARTGEILTGLNELILPGKRPGGAAVLSYEPKRYFLGMNIYYIIVFLAVLLLSSGIYLYLKNRFSGALLLLMMVSLSFFSGVVPPSTQIVTAGCFIPFIIFGFIRKRGKIRGGWLVVIIFAAIFTFPEMLRMDGSFTIQYFNAGKHSISIAKKSGSFQLEDVGQTLAYNQPHRIILGHTSYRLLVSPKEIILEPMDPEKIKAAPDFNGIISDTNLVKPGSNYIYLKYPHHFPLVTAAKAAGQKSLVVNDKKGNFLVMTKSGNRNYNSYRLGLILFIIVPFWLFLGVDLYGIPIPFSRFKKPVFRMGLLNADNAVIFHLVYFMLGLGYVIFGALALYNTGMWDNFQKYRSQGLPLFVGLFFASLVLSRYNRWLIFLYRVTIQKRFHVPFLIAVLLVLPLNYSKYFLYGGILYFILLFFFRLRKEIVYEYKNASSYPLNLKAVIEKPISDFEESGNRRIFFGLGKVLYNKGWNYLLVSDLLLMLALFFIVLQIFLGSELGVSVGGFFFLPIELGKIILTIYFADWVGRIDKGMELNVLWIYGLILIPFGFLVVFLKDFSPLLVFSFVFLYHIIKIKKSWLTKFILSAFIAVTFFLVVRDLSNYTFPFTYFSLIFTMLAVLFSIRLWTRKAGRSGKKMQLIKRILVSAVLVCVVAASNYIAFFRPPPVPGILGARISSWLNPWQDYNLSYQYVNSLWLMKGTGTFGKATGALASASNVPLIEKDLSFSLYVGVLGTMGTIFLFLTVFMLIVYVHKVSRRYLRWSHRSAAVWHIYLLEFLSVVFLAQFIIPSLYVVGLLPIMGQPLPFLSYSNNMLLLFALPFSFLMITLGRTSHREP